MNRRTTRTLLCLFATVALLVRLAVVVHERSWEHPAAMEHKGIAMALVAGRGFTYAQWRYYGPTSVQSPPMPFLLAGLFKATHAVSIAPDKNLVLNPHRAAEAYWVVFALNALAGSALVLLTYAAARQIGATEGAALLAAALVAVWPTQVYAAASVEVISMVTAALAGMVLLYYRAVRSGSARIWVAFAVLGSATALAEPVFLPALAVTGLLVLATRSLTWGQRIRNGVILAFAVVAIIGPWTARNYVAFGKLIPIKGSFGVNLWKGNNDFATGTDRLALTATEEAKLERQMATGGAGEPVDSPHQYDMLDLSQKLALRNQPEPRQDQLFRAWATRWIVAHPAKYLRLCGIRLLKTLTIDWDNPKSLHTSYLLTRLTVLFLSLAGLLVAWRQRWSLAFPAVVAGCALLTYTLTITAARFAFPFEPLQLILGAGAIMAVVTWLVPVRRPQPQRRTFEPVMPTVASAH